MNDVRRAVVIGSTKRGGFGHGLDLAFQDVPGVKVVAVADDDPAGLQAAVARTGAERGFADYRQMLAEVKPDLVAIGPRWTDQRLDMVLAACQAKAHIYCEKPFAPDLETADRMSAACDQAQVRLAMAHQFRGMAPVQRMLLDLAEGKFGRLLRMHARPKDDARGGAEELVVHGTHLFDLMVAIAGPPRWVWGQISSGDRDATLDDRRQATEPVGPVAGDSLCGIYGFDHGVRGTFASTANLYQDGKSPYGLWMECEQATLQIRSPGDVYVYPATAMIPEQPSYTWEKVWLEDWHFFPDHLPRPTNDWIARGNRVLAADLLNAIENERDPLSSLQNARWITEMVQGLHASHFARGVRLPLPLVDRRHPLRAD